MFEFGFSVRTGQKSLGFRNESEYDAAVERLNALVDEVGTIPAILVIA